MIFRHKKSAKASVSLLLVLCIAPCNVLGALTDSGGKQKTAVAAPKQRLAARLVARGNLPVLVNGYGSYTGATIFTGATIQTPGGVRATLELGELGRLDLSPNTIAVVDFGDGVINGTLKRGCAILTTNANVNGSLITPAGVSMAPDKTSGSSVSACSEEGSSEPENATTKKANQPAASNPWIFGLNPTSTIAMIGAGGIFAASRSKDKSRSFCCCCCCCGKNPSPSSPRGCGCH